MNTAVAPAFYRADFLNLNGEQIRQHMLNVDIDRLSPEEQGVYAAMKDAWQALHDPQNAPAHMKNFLNGYSEYAGLNMQNPQHRAQIGDMLVFPQNYSQQWAAFKEADQKAKVQQQADEMAGEVHQKAKTQQDKYIELVKKEMKRDLQSNSESEASQHFKELAASLQLNIHDPNTVDALVDAYMGVTFLQTDPALFQQSLQEQGYSNEQIQRLSQKGQEFLNKVEQSEKDYQKLQKKAQKKALVGTLVSAVLGVLAAIFVPKAFSKDGVMRNKNWKRIGISLVSGLGIASIAGKLLQRITSKPVMKEAEALMQNSTGHMHEMIAALMEERANRPQQPEVQQNQPQLTAAEQDQNRPRAVQEILDSRPPAQEGQRYQNGIMPRKERSSGLPLPQTSHLEGVHTRDHQAATQESAIY